MMIVQSGFALSSLAFQGVRVPLGPEHMGSYSATRVE